LLHDGAERGGKAAAQGRGALERHVVRQHAQVSIRARQRDVLRKGARLCKSRLLLSFTDCCAASIALATAAARQYERRGHACAERQLDAGAALYYNSPHLVSWRKR
jgi:hypothetical protein